MKLKIRIRKAVAFTRTLFLVVFLFFVGLAVCSIDGESFLFPAICFGVSVICFGISYALDRLLFETE